jgi:hypothetical protein
LARQWRKFVFVAFADFEREKILSLQGCYKPFFCFERKKTKPIADFGQAVIGAFAGNFQLNNPSWISC